MLNLITLTRTYISGIGEGIHWAKCDKHLYCQPMKLVLDTDNHIEIINREIKEASAHLTGEHLEKRVYRHAPPCGAGRNVCLLESEMMPLHPAV